MISQFRVCLTLALKNRPSVKLIRWTQGNDLKVLLRRRGENPELVPDAFFILETAEFKYPCFLEADRGTMTEERFVNKFRMYWRHYREERFNKTLGITHFRVLTITPNEARAENLCRAAKEADDRKQGSGMFLFMSETAYGTTRPDAILEAAWKCPKEESDARDYRIRRSYKTKDLVGCLNQPMADQPQPTRNRLLVAYITNYSHLHAMNKSRCYFH